MQKLTGRVTKAKLTEWIEKHRPHLALHEEPALVMSKGYYRVDVGPAHSYHGCGETWRDVAAELNAIDIQEA